MSDAQPEGWASEELDALAVNKKGKKTNVLRADAADGSVPYLDIHAIEQREVRHPARAARRAAANLLAKLETLLSKKELFNFADQLETRFAKEQAYVDKLTFSLLAKALKPSAGNSCRKARTTSTPPCCLPAS